MKNVLLLALLSILFITSCGDDDSSEPTEDCFSCISEVDTLTYCYFTNGETPTYTISDGENIITEYLVGETWEQLKERMDCGDAIVEPICFDCTVSGVTSTWCYVPGATEYTVTTEGVTQTLQVPSGVNLEDFIASQQALCE